MADYLSNDEYTPLDHAMEEDAYTYLNDEEGGERYLKAIRAVLAAGLDPKKVRPYMLRELGPTRQALAIRCGHAASYIYRTEFKPAAEEPRTVTIGTVGGGIVYDKSSAQPLRDVRGRIV